MISRNPCEVELVHPKHLLVPALQSHRQLSLGSLDKSRLRGAARRSHNVPKVREQLHRRLAKTPVGLVRQGDELLAEVVPPVLLALLLVALERRMAVFSGAMAQDPQAGFAGPRDSWLGR